MAEATTRGLREGLALAEEARAAEQRAIQEARAQEEARRIVEDAMASERRALDAIEEHLAQFWALVAATQGEFRQAEGWAQKAYSERARAYRAQVTLGERPDGMAVVVPNRTSALLETDKTVRAIMQWVR